MPHSLFSRLRSAWGDPDAVRWCILPLLCVAIAGNYYEYDAIAPVADFLRSERGFSQAQIGMLNAVFSLPNIVFALLGGVFIDRFGPARVALWAGAACFVGALFTAVGSPYAIMVFGRLIFGVSEEALFIALLAGLAQWFSRRGTALAMALFLCLARVGSYGADTSPGWAHALYAQGWQAPLWLGAAITGLSLVATSLYSLIDGKFRERRAQVAAAACAAPVRGWWSDLMSFDRSYWYILVLHVLYASVFFPFRSTFAIEYFQDAKGLSLEQAGLANSWVFFAAIFATPLFGFIADRIGHRALLLTAGTLLLSLTFLLLGTTHGNLWISTSLMGISFAVVPAIIWPATTLLVDARRLGTAFGLINMLQNVGLAAANLTAGWLNDAAAAGPHNPQGYAPMLWFFGCLSLVALAAVVLLWRRESGPHNHGLEAGRPRAERAPRSGGAPATLSSSE